MSEREDIEKPCVEYAESLGWMCRKLDTGVGGKGWLDQLFLGPEGDHFFVEFKQPGKLLSPKQADKRRLLRAMGHRVFICDSIDLFKQILETRRPPAFPIHGRE